MTQPPDSSGLVPPELAVARQAPDRNLALELVRVTEAAAMAAGTLGRPRRQERRRRRGRRRHAQALIGTVSMRGVVVIGEGEKDDAPMLYNGEEVGDGTGPAVRRRGRPDRRHHPDGQGHAECARGDRGRRARHACSTRPPCSTWRRSRPGPRPPTSSTSPPRSAENIRRVAKAKNEHPEDVTVCILDRPRHEELVQEVRDAGARIRFISDGDVAGAIMAARPGTGVDLLLGIGGTPEGIIAAAALRCMGGAIQGRLWPRDDDERQKAIDAGHDLDRVLTTNDLVAGRGHLLLRHRHHRRRTAARRALLRRLGAAPSRSCMRSKSGHDPGDRLIAPARQAARILRRGLRPHLTRSTTLRLKSAEALERARTCWWSRRMTSPAGRSSACAARCSA